MYPIIDKHIVTAHHQNTKSQQEIMNKNVLEIFSLDHKDNAVLDQLSGRYLEYRDLIKTPKKDIWNNSFAK